MIPHIIIFVSVLGIAYPQKELANLRCYNRNFTTYEKYFLENAENILNDQCFNMTRRTVFYTHGFKGTSKGPATKAVISALLETDCCNVILIDWENLASQSTNTIASAYFSSAIPNARKIAKYFAEALLKMLENGLQLPNVWLVGHSLGAQIFGMAGNRLQKNGILLPWITGLDPASIGFEGAAGNLNKNSAKFVDIVHSDPNKYGYKRSYGTVDYWPNFSPGYFTQPGCPVGRFPPFSTSDLCSHNRSWQYFVDAILYPKSMMAVQAYNYQHWKSYTAVSSAEILHLGEYTSKRSKGNFYFTTNEQNPFGRGVKGLVPL